VTAEVGRTRKNRVLLVEDEAAIRFAMRDFLEASGYRIQEAPSCAAAHERLRAFRPDALILDLRFPEGDAHEWIARLKELGSGAAVIVLTAHAGADSARKALAAGAERYLLKPVKLRELLLVLEDVIRRERAPVRGSAPGSAAPSA
jgi:DNA-binding response OmpR family regulator